MYCPLHDLYARKARLDWCDASVYQMAEIALQVIDQVTIVMDFDRGADHDDVVKRVLHERRGPADTQATGVARPGRTRPGLRGDARTYFRGNGRRVIRRGRRIAARPADRRGRATRLPGRGATLHGEVGRPRDTLADRPAHHSGSVHGRTSVAPPGRRIPTALRTAMRWP